MFGTSFPLSLSGRYLYAVLLVASIAFVLPAFFKYPFEPTDLYAHEFFLRDFVDAWRDGILFPRWAHGMYGGCGDATFFFYSPLAYFFSAPFYLLLGDAKNALLLSAVLATFAAALAMYRYLREFATPLYALFGTVIYIFSVGKIGTLYFRGSFSEYWAYAAVPLILLAIRRLCRGEYRYIPLLALSLAFTIMSSLSMCTVLSFFLPFYAWYEWRQSHHNTCKKIAALSISLAGACSLSAALLIPFYVNLPYVALSTPSPRTYQLPPLWLLLDVLFFSISFYMLYRLHPCKKPDVLRSFLLFITWMLLWFLFLFLPISSFLWDHIPLLAALQEPERLGFIFPFLFAPLGMIYLLQREEEAKGNIGVIILLSCILTIGLDYEVSSPHGIMRQASVRAFHEFTPSQVDIARWKTFKDIKDSADLCAQPLHLLKGSATSKVIDWRPYSSRFSITADRTSTFRIGRFFYPYWQITEGSATIRTETHSGQILLDVPPGKQTLRLSFVNPPSIGWANGFSLLNLMVWGTMVIIYARKKVYHPTSTIA